MHWYKWCVSKILSLNRINCIQCCWSFFLYYYYWKLNNLCYLPVEVAARALPRAPLAGLQEQSEARAHERAAREHHRGSALPGWSSPGSWSRSCPLSEPRDDRNPVNGAVRVRHAAKRDSHDHCLHARVSYLFFLDLKKQQQQQTFNFTWHGAGQTSKQSTNKVLVVSLHGRKKKKPATGQQQVRL